MEYLVIAEFKEGSSLQPGQEVIEIREIQPFEILLLDSHVKFFLDDPNRIFSQEEDLRLIFKNGMPFRCFVQNGNHRLYVSNRLGIKKVVIERANELLWDEDFELFFESAMDAYNVGVRNWNQPKVMEDLELLALLSTQEMVQAYMMNSSFEEQQKKEVMRIGE